MEFNAIDMGKKLEERNDWLFTQSYSIGHFFGRGYSDIQYVSHQSIHKLREMVYEQINEELPEVIKKFESIIAN